MLRSYFSDVINESAEGVHVLGQKGGFFASADIGRMRRVDVKIMERLIGSKEKVRKEESRSEKGLLEEIFRKKVEGSCLA